MMEDHDGTRYELPKQYSIFLQVDSQSDPNRVRRVNLVQRHRRRLIEQSSVTFHLQVALSRCCHQLYVVAIHLHLPWLGNLMITLLDSTVFVFILELIQMRRYRTDTIQQLTVRTPDYLLKNNAYCAPHRLDLKISNVRRSLAPLATACHQ
jgi:hypothetical protein